MDYKNKAFSLIELTIVLTVIALLTTIVISSKKALQNAKVIAFIDQVQQYKMAYETFVEQYGAPPGDVQNATDLFTGVQSPGGGDGLLDYNSTATSKYGAGGAESNAAWQHLKYAGLVKGNFPGTSGGTIAVNYPECKLTRDCSLHISGVNIHSKMASEQNYLGTWRHYNSSTQAVPVKHAYSIDLKIDDGLPYHGWVNSFTPTTDCTGDVDDAWSGNKENDTYNASTATAYCAMMFALDLDSITWN